MQSIFASLMRPKESTPASGPSDCRRLSGGAVHADSVCANAGPNPGDVRQVILLNESLRQHVDELRAEVVVRSEVAVQLAVKVVALRQKLQRWEAEMQEMKAGGFSGDVVPRGIPLCTGNNNDSSGEGSRECCESPAICCSEFGLHAATQEVAGVQESRRVGSLSMPPDGMGCQSLSSNTELRARLSEMEEQTAVWKQRVKAALKVSQERERALLSDNISLQQKLQELQGSLNEATFHIEAAALRSARQSTRIDRESQTDSPNEWTESVGEPRDDISVQLSGGNHHSPRRLSSGSPSLVVNSHEKPMGVLSAAETETKGSTARAKLQQQLECASDGGSCSRDCNYPAFPYPPPSPLLLNGGDGMPVEIGGHDMQPPPFIIGVHYSNGEEWSLQTKLRVVPGMTVLQLKERCCMTFYERHHVTLNPATLCVGFYHAKAKRQVVLSDHRELHSFAHFQRCEREKVPVLLSLTPADNLSKLVQNTMNATMAAQVTRTSPTAPNRGGDLMAPCGVAFPSHSPSYPRANLH